MGDWLVWGQNLDPNLHQDTLKLESSHQGFDWCDKNAVVPVSCVKSNKSFFRGNNFDSAQTTIDTYGVLDFLWGTTNG
jgi:hypothetical protein